MTFATTESAFIDLIALRNWHFKASMDTERTSAMRRWHRSQVDYITKRLYGEKHSQRTALKIALIEILADSYRTNLHMQAGSLGPFAWKKFCEAAKSKIANTRGKPTK